MTTPYRVLVTGSRDWAASTTVWAAINEARAEALLSGRRLIVVHGACPRGADAHAAAWCKTANCFGNAVTEEEHPANWRPNGQLDRGAGFRRNAAMVALGADICLAFVGPCTKPNCPEPQPHGSHGATHCADLAEAAGITTKRYTA